MLTLADSGPGIDEAMRRQLFQPFATGDDRHGTGLGLAICREIVRSLGGLLSLDNRLQQGRVAGLDATVRLELAAPEED